VIVVSGHTAIDHICRVVHLPPRNGSTAVTDHQTFFGGGAANIAAGIAKLGEPVALLSAVGDDFTGSPYERWLESLGVQLNLFRINHAHTPTAFVFTDQAGDQVTYFEWGASQVFSHADPPPLPFVHMATADPVFNVKVARSAEFSSFDPGQDLYRYTAVQLRAILGRISILFANQHEVEGMCRTLTLTRDDLANLVPMAVFTKGKSGCTLLIRGKEEIEIPALPVKAIDPTGAGDAFRAGFLSGYTRELIPEVCALIGTVTASFAVESAGCQTNLPLWDDMRRRYIEHFGKDKGL